MTVGPRWVNRCIASLRFGRCRGAALLFDALEPVLETTQRVALLAKLDFGSGAPLFQLQKILCLEAIELDLERRDAPLTRGDVREQLLALTSETVGALLQEVAVQQGLHVALPPNRERDLAIVVDALRRRCIRGGTRAELRHVHA